MCLQINVTAADDLCLQIFTSLGFEGTMVVLMILAPRDCSCAKRIASYYVYQKVIASKLKKSSMTDMGACLWKFT